MADRTVDAHEGERPTKKGGFRVTVSVDRMTVVYKSEAANAKVASDESFDRAVAEFGKGALIQVKTVVEN